MYHKVKIGQLSNTQISRLLNGHGVRVSTGSNHEIELSKEQLKKFLKANEKSKAITLTLDPFQMQAHQFLRGSGSGGSSGGAIGRRNKYNKWVDTLGARDVINAGMSKARSSINGSGSVGRRNKFNKWVDTLSAREVIDAGMSKARSSINGSGIRSDLYVRAHQKDAQKLTGKYMPSMPDYDVVKPPLKIGFGLKKRKAPKRKSMNGSALLPAGY